MPVIDSTWTEGALTFRFPEGQGLASKYDDWSHYRNAFQSACGGHKAVDLVYAETQTRTAWLIEVKDYRVHARTKAVDLADEIAIKIRDTLAGLVAAQSRANDAEERRCARALLRADRLKVVCHLEQPAKHSRLRPRAIEPDKLMLKLRTVLKAIDPHPVVVDHASLTALMNWQVDAH